jgi:ribosomal protein S18 acetylase RimI-like enzyme
MDNRVISEQSFDIREFSEQDMDEITHLMKNLCEIKDQEFNEERWRNSLETHMKQDTDSEVLVAFNKETNQVLGMANCSVKRSENGFRFGYLSNLIVREEKRRTGIGEMLIHHAIDYFRRSHVDSVRLALKSDMNKAARKLIIKTGFKKLFEIWNLDL